MSGPSDEQLIRTLSSGRESALSELLERHEAPVRAWLARRLPLYEDAEEATQDVFVKVRRGAHTFNGTSTFLPWLRAITRNVLRDRLRKSSGPRTVRLESEPSEHLTLWRRDVAADEVREALERLPGEYRAALTLKFLARMSYREAAVELGLSTRGFETRLMRAKVRLRAAILTARGDADGL